MADEQQLAILKQGVEAWNQWREKNKEPIDLSGADLTGLDLSEAELYRADLSGANLTEVNLFKANLTKAELSKAKLYKAILTSADLSHANIIESNLIETDLALADLAFTNLVKTILTGAVLTAAILRNADLSGANLSEANLYRADLKGANLSNANLTGANLQESTLVRTNIEQAILTGCKVYGISAWSLIGKPGGQSNLIITPDDEADISVDDLQVAQFIYLLLDNQNVRNVIDTITSKAVLILGRFTNERKAVLDAIRKELRIRNFTPIVFDFDKPVSKDFTATVETLARMARFIIADLTDPRSIPHELATVVPFLRTTPVLPITLQGAGGYTMFDDFKVYPWVLKRYEYKDSISLIAALPEVIAPANEMAESFRKQT